MFISKIRLFFKSGHKRTILAKKNILFGFLIKALAMFFTFSIMSLSIKYLGKDNYGIWVVISGVIAWSSVFDLGLTHGLRNKIAEVLAKEQIDLGKYYVATTYMFLLIICLLFLIIFVPLVFWIDWQHFLNIHTIENSEIRLLIFTVFSAFLMQLILKPITALLYAYQWPSAIQFISLMGLVVSFMFICYLFVLHKNISLKLYFILMSSSPVIVLMIASIYLYFRKFKIFLPRTRNIRYKFFKDLAGFGSAIFVIQLSGLIIFQTDNIIISNIFGPDSVTSYSVVYKFFSIFLIAKGIIVSPFWTAFTDAYHRNEIAWIKKTINKLIKIILLLSLLVFLSVFFANDFYRFWIGSDLNIPISLSMSVAVFVILNSFFGIHPYFLNGIGKIKLQMYISIITAIINIPLSYLFAEYFNFGIKGVIFATIVCISISGTINIIQYYKIINGVSKGVWNK